MINILITPPNCPSIVPSVTQKKWTRSDISFNFGFTSDTVSWDWYTDSNGNYKFWDNNKTTTKSKTISGSGKRKIKVKVYDIAGNARDCFTDHEYWIDKVAPSNIKITGNPGCVSQPNTITLTLSADEKESGIDYWQYGYNNMNNMTTYPNSAKSPFMTTPFSAVRNDNTYLRVCDKVGNCGYGTTQICIKNSKPDFGGNVGQWKVLYNQRSSCDFWAAHPYGGSCPSGVYGNTIGKLDVSYSGNNFTFKWAIANGGETWINNSYYVNFIIKKNGSVISTTQIKDPYGDGWFPGTTHDGTITKSLSSGSYEIFFEGNSFDPSYTVSMGTIVVH